MAKQLFSVPIKTTGGSITCTEPTPAVYLLTFVSPPDNRLTTTFCQAMLDALDLLEFSGYESGVVITTSGIPKFYSNGLDLDHAMSTEGFFEYSLYKLFNRFLTYPMPTIALLNGHAFAGGLMTAMHHDYRIMNPSKGYICLNELDFGVPLMPAMSAIFRIKTSPATYRSLALEAHRFNGKEAVEAGLVDGLGGLEEVLELVAKRKLVEKGRTGIYAAMKREMYREQVACLSVEGGKIDEKRLQKERETEDARKQEGERRVGEIKGKAKL